MKLELKKIGNSTGVILPKELLVELGLEQGDTVFVSKTPDGGVRLSPADPTFDKAMEIARKAMKTYSNTLRELAK
ncbi:putative addiction module antidote [Hartmannibacter diazotrophicus]|uniref:Putative addiction module antidote n=1 Tax=Hartmannibacter diazotrophicus TaxID=1482074 RepID=A0A2C9DAA4_9HYPH|nr:AbrB/MazE/SpoVT family DNA-binding domain-containing protein [Hartmannibacter diazotrophicus]SON57217.1 putative addiction module antidote [Hartmannibacter diazotrophicus]